MKTARNNFRTVRLLIQVLLIAILTACRQEKPAADGRVVAIKDGDTIEVMEQGKAITVRLAEVDAPEKNQDFGTQARKFTSDLAFGKNVTLQRQNTDRYGRVVANVLLPDGRSLNQELVKNGYAWHYKDYSKSPELANLEADARQYRRGLWAKPNPVAPWEFRKAKRTKHQQAPESQVKSGSTISQLPGNTPVWVCSSKTVKVFHVRENCPRLQRCGKVILPMTKAEAETAGKGKPCSTCTI